jgi:putative restriction endonuclease
MSSMLEHYARKFRRLRSDRNARWPSVALNRSPYKPLLLLSVIDLFAQGSIVANLVEISADLSELFSIYCALVLPSDWRSNIAMPFFHLSREGFWHLVPLPGKEIVVSSGRLLRSVSLLTDNVQGARLDEDLFVLLCQEKPRGMLRTALIETYFASEIWPKLIEQSSINAEAFEYSLILLEQARQHKVREGQAAQKEYQQPARDQGFRRAVVTAYDHRCALCGVRMLTPAGHTAVAAAHIIPWSVSHNDDPRNGIALCHLCHWTFDEGLMGVSPDYVVMASPQLAARENVPGHLATLNGRGMIGPNEQQLWPERNSLKWHLRKVFLKH